MKRRARQLTSSPRRWALRPLPAALMAAMMPMASWAFNIGQVVQGQVSSSTSGNSTNVTVHTNTAIVNTKDSSIRANESVSIDMLSGRSSLLVRDTSYDPTYLLGSLQTNGRVFFLNPNGIVFGSGFRADVGSLVASTLNMSDGDFMKGQYKFSSVPGGAGAITQAAGSLIQARDTVAFVAPQVTQAGTIEAPRVGLAAGTEALLDLDGDGLIFLQVGNAQEAATRLSQLGTIVADGGTVDIQARARETLADTVLNVDGIIRARSLGTREGRVVIDGGSSGVTAVNGVVDVTGDDAGERGGQISVLGDKVGLFGSASLDASGQAGGGTVLVGGNYQGSGDERRASRTYIGQDATIKANAITGGDGGKVIVWSDEVTRFFGTIESQGGQQGGNGGFVEVSGKQSLAFDGLVKLDAPLGLGGVLLLDPQDIRLVASGGTTLTNKPNGTPDVAFADAAGTTVSINVDGTVTGASELRLQASQDIFLETNLTMDNNNSVVFSAGRHISLGANLLRVQGTGTITLTANAANGSGSELDGIGGITTTSGGLIQADSGLVTLSAGSTGINVSTQVSNLSVSTTNSGNVTVSNSGDLTFATTASNVAGSLTATATNSGSINNTAAIAVTGNASFETTTAEEDINLNSLTVGGTLSVTTDALANTGNATIVSGNAINLGTSRVRGNLSITAGGPITNSSTLAVTGTSAFSTTTAPNGITLTNVTLGGAASFNTVSATSQADVSVTSTSAVTLGTSSVRGNLSVRSGGHITQTGALTVSGDTSLRVDSASSDILLGNQANSLAGTVAVTGTLANVRDLAIRNIHDNAALPSGLASMSSLRDLTLIYTGNVDVIALPALSLRNITIESGRTSGTNGTGGDRAITDSGTITATGNASFTTTGAARDIVVDQLNVAGTISVNSNATNGDVVVVNAQDVELATSSVGGNLSVTSGSHITQASGATLTVGGTTTLEVGASNSDILLGNAGNSMAGAITLNQKARIRDLALTNTHAAAALPSLSGTTNLNNLTLNFTTANVTLVAADIDITGNLSVTSGGATGITISGAAAARVKVDGTASFTTTANNASIVANKLAVTDAIAVNTTGPTGNATVVNDTAIKLAASNVGGNLTATATMDNISEAPTIGTGTVSVGGNASYTATAANGTITLNRQAVTGSFAVNTNGANGDVTIVNTTDVHLAGSTVGGNLTVTATNGNITDSGTVNVDGNASYTASTAGTTIVLDTQAVDGTIAVNTQGAAGHATIVNATALTLAASSVGGNLTATATLGNLTDGGTITVGGNASFTTSENNANILANQLAVTGRLAANTTGPTGNATLVNTKDVELAASRVGGNLTVTASTGGISDSGTVAVGGNASYTNTIAGNTITLNQQDVDGSFTLSALGSGANVTIVNANGVALATSGIGGNLDVTATDGNITDTGTITVGGTARYIASAADRTITLDTQVVTGAFTVGTNGTNGDVAITNNTGVELAASSIGGDLTVTASNGNITDTGTIVVGGNASYTATTANTGITLDTQNVTGTFALNTNGATGHALIDNTQDVVLATSSVGGNLGITSGSSISQATGATLTVGGTTTLAVGSAASEINLGNTGNSLGNIIFAGTLTNIRDLAVANGSASAASPSLAGLSLRNLTLNFSAANIDLSGLSISGNLAVTSGGAGGITDSGTSTVGGNASFTTTASNAVINLDQLAVTGTVSANTTGTMGHVTLVNASGVNLATSNVGGNLTATATAGNIIDSGTVTVGGNASYTTATANNTITVNEQAVTGSFTVNTNGVGANATIVNATGVTLAASTVAGNLSVTATDGNITDTGTITVAGTARYIASTANRTITLDTQAVMGAFTLSTSGANGDVAITNSTGVALAASTIGGDLSVTAGSGNITDTGTISVGGGASYATTASGATITVGNQNVTGAIALSTNGLGANVVLNNAQAVVLATSNIGGSLEVTSSSHITQASGATLTTGDAVTVAVLNPNSDIELGNGGNAFGGVFTISGNKDNVRDLALGGSTFTSLFPLNNLSNLRNLTLNFSTADITLPSLTILGNLSVTSGGATGITIGGAPTDRVVVRGTASFTTTANNADIVVDKLAVQGTISVNTTGPTGNATVVNNTDINLATSRVGGSLDVTANAGNISDAATASPDTVRVGGNASYTTLATDATITLNEQDIGGTVTLSTTGSNAHVQIVNARTLTLNASTIGGNLNVTALTGDLADGGLITVGGNASYTTSGNDATITLDTQDITGTVALNTTGTNGNASLANATGIDLAASNVGGNLAATATTGNITDVGTITVGGRASYTTSASNATILVNQQAVTGGVSVNTSGALGHATIVNTAGVLLGASNVGGNLSVTAGGAITQNGALDVDGTTTLSASGHAITLTNTGNDFTGSVSATGAAVQITDTNALNAAITASGAATLIAGGNLGVSGSAAGLTTTTTAGGTTAFGTTSVTGNLSTTSAGAVSQGAAQALTVTGTSNVSASGQTITLTNTGNNFT
ncbi:MAG: filamentous hemagglutinin N-terminal domain-containing protein, partial [Aquabacterium sp.]|uniref:filamentous hemagglutinin N-terminal domain-containing protein n=1 Tax=Aquabacterium sp. TaxID=1872578 RepID=UPI003BAE676E